MMPAEPNVTQRSLPDEIVHSMESARRNIGFHLAAWRTIRRDTVRARMLQQERTLILDGSAAPTSHESGQRRHILHPATYAKI